MDNTNNNVGGLQKDVPMGLWFLQFHLGIPY